MRAFTIYTDRFEAIAREAVRRFSEFAGVPAEAVSVSEETAHVDKLKNLLSFDGPVWFFDADLWFVQKTNLPVLHEAKLLISTPSVSDAVKQRCAEDEIDYRKAFCTCLLGLHMGHQETRSMVEHAMEIQAHACPNGRPSVDERFLNRAAQERGFDFVLLRNINHTSLAMGEETCAVHAARKRNKEAWLRAAAEVWRTKAW